MNRLATGKGIVQTFWSKRVREASTAANPPERPRFRGRRYLLALVSALVIGLTLFATMTDDLWAAIELAYYRGASTNNAVFLEWATVREVNLKGFEIMCKRVTDPDTAFHPIGSRIAMGSPTSGATYNFDVTFGLIPGESYCFRLREITSDQTPGEAFDLCGYGLGVTPPPPTPATGATVVVSIPLTLTPTVLAVTPVPGLDAAPTLGPTVDPFATPSPTIDLFATLTPTVDAFATPTLIPTSTLPVDQGISPVATPTATTDPSLQQQLNPQPTSPLQTPAAMIQNPNGVAAQLPLTGSETPTQMPMESATAPEIPTEIATATPTATATLTTTTPITLSQAGDGNVAALPVIPDASAPLAAAEATATPLYVVVTATPTPLPAVALAPTFTPWPTAVPTAAMGFSNLLVPNTQNLMVGLLCLIFLSASGLGALGLVTSVLYMRSQTRRDRLPGPIYERRRY
jgi:hypothetical protein